MKDNIEEILKIISNSETGMTITELVNNSEYSRSTVRTCLANLEGAEKIVYRKVGMAKLYFRTKVGSEDKTDNK